MGPDPQRPRRFATAQEEFDHGVRNELSAIVARVLLKHPDLLKPVEDAEGHTHSVAHRVTKECLLAMENIFRLYGRYDIRWPDQPDK